MLRFQIIFALVKIAFPFNIEDSNPALIQQNVQKENNGNRSDFFGYEIQLGYGSDDALK